MKPVRLFHRRFSIEIPRWLGGCWSNVAEEQRIFRGRRFIADGNLKTVKYTTDYRVFYKIDPVQDAGCVEVGPSGKPSPLPSAVGLVTHDISTAGANGVNSWESRWSERSTRTLTILAWIGSSLRFGLLAVCCRCTFTYLSGCDLHLKAPGGGSCDKRAGNNTSITCLLVTSPPQLTAQKATREFHWSFWPVRLDFRSLLE